MRVWKFFLAVAGLILVADCTIPMAGAAPSTASAATPPPPSGYGATDSRILNLINAQRKQQGLRPLAYNTQLDQMAKIQAGNMARYQRMAHTLPNANLPTLGDRARYVGYTYGKIAENVALGYPNAETVVEGWMNSSGHRRNILDREVVETGIGIARSSAGGLYYCQVFGRQLASF